MYIPTAEEKKVLKSTGIIPTNDGNYSARIITVNGMVTAEQARVISEVAEKFGSGQILYTTRLTVEIPGIKYENVEAFTEFISQVGLVTGGTSSRVRPIVACKGTLCIHGLFDTLKMAEEIHEVFYKGWYDVKLPHKFKIGIGGCPNNCVKPQLHDFGIMGQRVPIFDKDMCNSCKKCPPLEVCPIQAIKRDNDEVVLDQSVCNNCGKCIENCNFDCIEEDRFGYKLYIGGKWGKIPRIGTPVPGIFSSEEVMAIIEKTLLVYREQGITGERFGVSVDRIGVDKFISQILSNDILERKQTILDALLHITGGATC